MFFSGHNLSHIAIRIKAAMNNRCNRSSTITPKVCFSLSNLWNFPGNNVGTHYSPKIFCLTYWSRAALLPWLVHVCGWYGVTSRYKLIIIDHKHAQQVAISQEHARRAETEEGGGCHIKLILIRGRVLLYKSALIMNTPYTTLLYYDKKGVED